MNLSGDFTVAERTHTVNIQLCPDLGDVGADFQNVLNQVVISPVDKLSVVHSDVIKTAFVDMDQAVNRAVITVETPQRSAPYSIGFKGRAKYRIAFPSMIRNKW